MLLAALAVLLLAAGLVACGGGDDPDSSATDVASQRQGGGDASSNGEGEASGEPKSGGGGQSGDSSGRDSGGFVPKQHEDTGGGSEQFRTRGGDNSVQEFGEEAGEEEFEAAAVALHNFLDARAEGEWAAACEYLASDVVGSLEKLAAQAKGVEETTCAAILGKLTNPAAKEDLREEAEEADVGSLRVEGDRSFVIYHGTGDVILAMAMKQEDGEWKVASLAGTPLN